MKGKPMKILTIGDVVGEAGLDALHALLRRIKRDTGADFVIVNGENAAGNGVLPRQAEDIARTASGRMPRGA